MKHSRAMLRRRGTIWYYSGYTKSHLWILSATTSLFSAIGAGALMAAALGMYQEGYFWHVMSVAGCAFMATIAASMTSIAVLTLYAGASRVGLLEEDRDGAEDA